MSSVTGHAHGSGFGELVAQVGAGEHRDDAGYRGAAASCRSSGSSRARPGCGRPHVQRARDLEVVDEPGLAGEQRRVLPPELARLPYDGHRLLPIVSAAASTAFTMLW